MATGLNSLESWLQPAAVQLVNIAAAAGLTPKVSSARRSHAQQALLYRRFLAGQSRFPAAPPGNSMHELGLAFDLWINDESQLADLGSVWENQMGGVWGGHFRDPIHFEAGGDSVVEAPGDAPEVPAEPDRGLIARSVDFVGSFAPGISDIVAAAEVSKLVNPSLAKSSVIQMLSHPSQMIMDQPQIRFLRWVWNSF